MNTYRHPRPPSKDLLLTLTWCLVLFSSLSASAQTSPVTYWMYFDLPPMFIIDDKGALNGLGKDIQDILIAEMPELFHIQTPASPKRIFSDIFHGLQVIAIGPEKTPDRTAFMTYSSIPCFIGPPPVLAFREEDKGIYSSGRPVSAKTFLADRSLTFGYLPELAYGALAPLVAERLTGDNVLEIQGVLPVDKGLQLLATGRVDYVIINPLAFRYALNHHSYASPLASAPIEELSGDISVGYIACPATPWGRQMIQRIDLILGRSILSGEYRDLYTRWMPEDSIPDFHANYSAIIEKAASALAR